MYNWVPLMIFKVFPCRTLDDGLLPPLWRYAELVQCFVIGLWHHCKILIHIAIFVNPIAALSPPSNIQFVSAAPSSICSMYGITRCQLPRWTCHLWSRNPPDLVYLHRSIFWSRSRSSYFSTIFSRSFSHHPPPSFSLFSHHFPIVSPNSNDWASHNAILVYI